MISDVEHLFHVPVGLFSIFKKKAYSGPLLILDCVFFAIEFHECFIYFRY